MNIVNLNRNGAAMQSAWKSVLDEDDDTDWALFGYEGGQQGYVLNFVSKGDGGVEELLEDLNANKIMYGFIRIEDPKTRCVIQTLAPRQQSFVISCVSCFRGKITLLYDSCCC